MMTAEQVREAIVVALGRERVDRFFRSSARIAIGTDRVELRMINDFLAEWIRSHFKTQITAAIQQAAGENIEVIICFGDKK